MREEMSNYKKQIDPEKEVVTELKRSDIFCLKVCKCI